MNIRASYKTRNLISDMALALLIFLFFSFAVMSPTLGNTGFYSRYLNDGSITTQLQEKLNEETEIIANETGIEPKAFEFAVGQNKISTIQREIIKSAFSGGNYDYSDSSNIENCYRDGITEYYRFNGLELDQDALELAVPKACKALNSVMGIDNNREFKSFSKKLSETSIILAVAMLILAAALGFRMFTGAGGSTSVLSHFASSMISAGFAWVLLFVVNLIVDFCDKLYLTNNEAVNYALSGASNTYFFIEALFGIALIIGGSSMMIYVYNYYVKKAQKQKQEISINKNLYVHNEGGDDITIEEIVKDRREKARQRFNEQEKK